MTLREFFSQGPACTRQDLKALGARRVAYAFEMFHRAIACQIPEHKRLYFRFARQARAAE